MSRKQVALTLGMLTLLLLILPMTLFSTQPTRLLVRIPGAVFLSETDWRSHHKRIAITLQIPGV